MSRVIETRQQLIARIEAIQAQLDELDAGEAPRDDLVENVGDVPKFKPAEGLAGGSVARFRGAFDLNPAMMMIVDVASGIILDVNLAYERRLGHAKQDVVGVPGRLGFAVANSAAKEDMTKSIRENDRLSEYELTLVTGNNEEIVVLVFAEPMDLQGQRLHVITFIEITELKDAQASLVASEARFRTLVENSYDVINMFSPDGQLLYTSPSIERMLGFSPEELKKLHPLEIMHPEDSAWGMQQFQSCLYTPGAVSHFTLRLRHKDGTCRTVEVTGTNLLDAPGIHAMVSVFHDITEGKRAERELRDSETRLQAIFDHHFQLTGLLDCDGRLLAANKTALDFAGADESDVLGKNFWETPWWDPPQQSTVQHAIQRAAQGEFVRFECTHIRVDGEVRDFDFSLSPIRDDDGNVVYLVPEGRDITEQKHAEESLRRTEAELAHVARVSSMGEMVGGLAHELNQPLYTIQNYGKACGNVLRDDGEVDRNQLSEWLDEITSTAEYAGEVLSRLRNFVNRVPSEITEVDLGETIELAVSLVQHEARQQGITIEQSIPVDLPRAVADAIQVQQVLVNLLRNGFEAIHQQSFGNPRITILAEAKGALIEVAVADNGIGLPSDSSLMIFEAFNSTKPDSMGLGLAISKTIVDAHDGTLVAEDRPGGGAVFCFTLPIYRRD